MATTARAGGCLRCGKPGHWAKDCTAPPSEWLPRQQTQSQRPGSGAAAAPAAPSGDKEGATGENNPAAANDAPPGQPPARGASASRKRKHKRPKVTLDLLKEERGIPFVFRDFPDLFRRQFKGPGHEAGDLRRMLEMYKRWGERIFPSATFDGFVLGVEKLSSQNVVKHELRELRMGVLQEAQKALEAPQQPEDEEALAMQEDGEGAGAQAAGAQHQQQQEEAGVGAADDEEDDFLELLEEEDPLGDDELMGYFEEGAGGGGARARAPGPQFDPEEAFLELAEEDEEEEAEGLGQGPNADELDLAAGLGEAHAGAQQGAGADGAPAWEEESYLELAEEEEEEEGDGDAVDQAVGGAGGGQAEEQGQPAGSPAGDDGLAALGQRNGEAGEAEDLSHAVTGGSQQAEQEADAPAALQAEAAVGEAGASEAAVGEAGASEAAVGEAGASEAAAGEAGASEAAVGEAGASEAAAGEAGASEAAGQTVGTEASCGRPQSERMGAQDAVRQSYLMVAAMHETQPQSQFDLGSIDDDELLGLMEGDD